MTIQQWIDWWTGLHPYGSSTLLTDFLHNDVNGVLFLWDRFIEGTPPQFAPLDRRIGDDGNLLSPNVASLFPTSPPRDKGAPGTPGGGPLVGPTPPGYLGGFAALQAARAAANRAAAGTISAAQRLAQAQAYAAAQAAAAALAAQGTPSGQPIGTTGPGNIPMNPLSPGFRFPRFPLPGSANPGPNLPPVSLPAKPIPISVTNPITYVPGAANQPTGATNPNGTPAGETSSTLRNLGTLALLTSPAWVAVAYVKWPSLRHLFR